MFKFTIVDDTDNSTLHETKIFYDYLHSIQLKTTRTTWIYPSADNFYGDSLSNPEYVKYLLEMKNRGFEIALHNVRSGSTPRDLTLSGIDVFKSVFNEFPKLHANHAWNKENLYWGSKRFCFPLGKIFGMRRDPIEYEGEVESSIYFWGDICKERIKYVRNHTYDQLDLRSINAHRPYHDSSKGYVNYWFSSTDCRDINRFKKIVNKDSIDKLVSNGGVSILYIHSAYGFVNQGKIHPYVKEMLEYISMHDGSFKPASTILDEVIDEYGDLQFNYLKKLSMDIKWVRDRVLV